MNKTRIVWLWESKNGHSWRRYTDIEIEILEEAFRNEAALVDLDYYRIDLRKFIQINKENLKKTRHIQRCIVDQKLDGSREDRFASSQNLINKSFTNYSKSDISAFAYHWWEKNSNKMNSYADQLEDAAQGVIHEGLKLGKITDAHWIASQLRDVKNKSWLEIAKKCIFIYTLDSFFYQLLNQSLRNDDRSKVDTLGAFCFLLSTVDSSSDLVQTHRYRGLVYRTAQLTIEQIVSYQTSINQGLKCWLNFTSTSRSRALAEQYSGNVLFIIDIRSSYYGLHIAPFSAYPQEDEVLLRASQKFRIKNVDYDEKISKYLIYIVIDDM